MHRRLRRMRTSVRTLSRLAVGLGSIFVSPPDLPEDASDDEWDLAVDVDELQATVIGGLHGRSVTTA